MDYAYIPVFYQGWLRKALQYQRHDAELIADLTSVRDDHAYIADVQAKLIDKYHRDDLRKGREEVIEEIKRSPLSGRSRRSR
jgi:hypothetical protein